MARVSCSTGVASLGRDVEIHHEPESWTLEARQGGTGGKPKRWAATTEDDATKIAEQLIRTDERWRPMG